MGQTHYQKQIALRTKLINILERIIIDAKRNKPSFEELQETVNITVMKTKKIKRLNNFNHGYVNAVWDMLYKQFKETYTRFAYKWKGKLYWNVHDLPQEAQVLIAEEKLWGKIYYYTGQIFY